MAADVVVAVAAAEAVVAAVVVAAAVHAVVAVVAAVHAVVAVVAAVHAADTRPTERQLAGRPQRSDQTSRSVFHSANPASDGVTPEAGRVN